MRARALVIGLAAALAATSASAQGPKEWLFAYFHEPATQGIHFALSHDGKHFTPINNDQPVIKPEQPGEVMRDVFVTQGPDGKYRMVWTWGWHDNSLGYAESPDLIHWSPQRDIPVMQLFPDVRNVWAPETYWDTAKGEWVLVWSSTLGNGPDGNRIYYSLTKDFTQFTIPRLLFDPGYVVIDATIFHGTEFQGRGKYYLVFKDQTLQPLRYQIRYATGPSYEGPWSKPSAPITESWSEGPSVVHAGDQYIVYYDHYRSPRRYEAVASTDWKHWSAINDQVSLPAHCKHGSFLEISHDEAARLKAQWK